MWKKIRTTTARGMAALCLTALVVTAAQAQDPYESPDDAWISITGTVKAVAVDEFTLRYDEDDGDEGIITVEMDDGDRDADAYKLMPGDPVTVYGVVDDDLFETRTIEASSVYVANLDTYFYASSVDEEDTFLTMAPPVVSTTIVQGTVTEVGDEEFRIDNGLRQVLVEVDELPYNPLDDEGYQVIEVGDRVRVTGQMDYDFLEGRELVATSVTTLKKN
jgi:hypothetical protein